MARWTIFGLLLGGLLCPVETGYAQLVRIGRGGGVAVRAPFVRVDVGPYGTSVRAPFTAVDTPRYRARGRSSWYQYGDRGQYGPLPGYGSAPSSELLADPETDITRLDLPALRSSLIAQWNALQLDLRRFSTGAGWQRHLSLPPELFSGSGDPPIDVLQEILGRYARVANSEQYRVIARLASFQATHRLLAAYLDRLPQPPTEEPPAPPAENVPPPVPEPGLR